MAPRPYIHIQYFIVKITLSNERNVFYLVFFPQEHRLSVRVHVDYNNKMCQQYMFRSIAAVLARTHNLCFGTKKRNQRTNGPVNIPSSVEIGLPVPEKKILTGFYHIVAWRPSWSCDRHHVISFSFPCT